MKQIIDCDAGVFVVDENDKVLEEFPPDTKVSFCKTCEEPFNNGSTGFKDNDDYCGGMKCYKKKGE